MFIAIFVETIINKVIMDKEFFKGLNPLPKRAELIQREAKEFQLPPDEHRKWYIEIDIIRMGVLSRFAVVYGKDKFEAQANASAICRIENI